MFVAMMHRTDRPVNTSPYTTAVMLVLLTVNSTVHKYCNGTAVYISIYNCKHPSALLRAQSATATHYSSFPLLPLGS